MTAQLNYMMVRQRSADLRRAGEQARLATQVPAKRRRLRQQNMITRPTAKPGRGTTPLKVERAIGGAAVERRLTATARPLDGTLRHEVDFDGRRPIITDEPTRLGGTDTGPAPEELLPAMLAACASTKIVAYANARGLQLEGLRVDAVYDPEPTPRHVELVVHLPASLTDKQAERLQVIAGTCPVKRALEAGFTIGQAIVRIPTPTPAR